MKQYIRPMVQDELRRKLTSSECGYLIEVANGMPSDSESLLHYYVAVRERSLVRGKFWKIDVEQFLDKLNSLSHFELFTLIDAVFRFVDRMNRQEAIYLCDLFDEAAPARNRYYDRDAPFQTEVAHGQQI